MRTPSTIALLSSDGLSTLRSDVHTFWLEPSISEQLLTEGTLTFEVDASHETALARTFQPGQLIQIAYTDGGEIDEFRISVTDYADGKSPRLAISAQARWQDLGTVPITRTLAATGQVDTSFTIALVTPTVALTRLLANVPSPFAVGTVTGLSASQQSATVSLQIKNQMYLEGIRALANKIAEETGETCEYQLRRVGSTIYIDLVTQIGITGNRVVQADPTGVGPSNRLQLSARTDARTYAPRLVPTLEEEGTVLDIGAATFSLSGVAGQVLTLGSDVVPYDDFGKVVLYLGNSTRGYHLITGASQSTGTVTVATGAFAQGDVVHFATDNTGTQLTYLDAQSAPYGSKSRFQGYEGSYYPNLLKEAGIDETFNTTNGWNAVGSPTLTLLADERYTKLGSQSLRVQGAVGDGIESNPITTSEVYLWVWLNASILNGSFRLEVVDSAGTSYPGDSIIARDLLVQAIDGGAIKEFTSPVRVRITLLEAGSDIVLDACTLVPKGSGAGPWKPIMGAADLWRAAVQEIRRFDASDYTSYSGEWIDLADVVGMSYDDVVLGALITLKDGYDGTTFHTNLATRLVGLRRSLGANGWQASGSFQRVRLDILNVMLREEEEEGTPIDFGESLRLGDTFSKPTVNRDSDQAESGGLRYGVGLITVDDPHNLIQGVYWRAEKGGNITQGLGWNGPIALQSGTYTAQVELDPYHTSALQIEVRFKAPFAGSQHHQRYDWTFDWDKLPSFNAFSLAFGPYDEPNNRYQLLISREVSEDGDGMRYATSTVGAFNPDTAVNGDLTNYQAGKNGVFATGIYASPEQTIYVLAKAVKGDVQYYAPTFSVREITAPPPGAFYVQYSADGLGGWHNPPFIAGTDKYARQRVGLGGTWSDPMLIVAENGTDGGYTDYIFKRAATQPATPTGETPAGWSDAPPSENGEFLWMSKGEKDADNVLQGVWSAPVRFDGIDGDSVEVQYSVDGATGWHFPWVAGDLYVRQRVGDGPWSDPMKFIGDDGKDVTSHASTIAFSSPNRIQISWSAGSVTVGGTTYSGIPGATLTVTATWLYIFFDPDSPENLFTSTDGETAVAGGRIVLCRVRAGVVGEDVTAEFIPSIGTNSTRVLTAQEMRTNILKAISVLAEKVSAAFAKFGAVTIDGILDIVGGCIRLMRPGKTYDSISIDENGATLRGEDRLNYFQDSDLLSFRTAANVLKASIGHWLYSTSSIDALIVQAESGVDLQLNADKIALQSRTDEVEIESQQMAMENGGVFVLRSPDGLSSITLSCNNSGKLIADDGTTPHQLT